MILSGSGFNSMNIFKMNSRAEAASFCGPGHRSGRGTGNHHRHIKHLSTSNHRLYLTHASNTSRSMKVTSDD